MSKWAQRSRGARYIVGEDFLVLYHVLVGDGRKNICVASILFLSKVYFIKVHEEEKF